MISVEVPIPPLEPICGSWMITNKRTGTVTETFEREVAQKCANTGLYTVETALTYFGRINGTAK